ncbi:Fur family transcriptional regulator [Paenibacillus sp. MMO-58]|uniref:Fur family transcriptional regulator n=1 Tax=Paenibacillus sp. MMO-58 TaxID=3081290 RepID=UPI0030181139
MHNSYEHIIEAMNRQGLRLTEQRKSIARIFASTGHYCSAKEIYLKLMSAHPDISYDTVYRNLKMLLALGILDQIYLQDGARFKACLNRAGEVERQVICLHCGQIIPFEEGNVPLVSGMPNGFETISIRYYGYCRSCSNNTRKE